MNDASSKHWTHARLARAASRLIDSLERQAQVAPCVLEAAEVLRAQRDLLELHYLSPEVAHEASQGAYLQAQHLDWQASHHPDAHRRSDLLRRARTAFAAGDRLSALGPNANVTPGSQCNE